MWITRIKLDAYKFSKTEIYKFNDLTLVPVKRKYLMLRSLTTETENFLDHHIVVVVVAYIVVD